MPKTGTEPSPQGVIEHDGKLWKPKPGATASVEEFITARTLFIDVNQESRWNPWIRDDRHIEYERAIEVMDQWQRAEPGHRILTLKQLEARWASQDKQFERAHAELQKQRQARKANYDEERAHARVALIECQSRHSHDVSELTAYLDGSRYPKMDVARRRNKTDELEQTIAQHRAEIERLTTVVGDPETVIDQNGWLPHERRDYMLTHYRLDRERTVRALREQIPPLEATGDRKDRIDADLKRHRLNQLLAVPPQTPDDMCSDCPTPIAQHGWVTPPFDGPCPAWLQWRARLRRAREILEASARDRAPAPTPPAPTPQPLATIPSGLPISEVTRRLMELQAKYPDAEVRRGRANRWELWPMDSSQ